MQLAIFNPTKTLAAKAALFAVTVGALLGGGAATANAATVRATPWPTTLAQAQSEWPGARLVTPGSAVRAGSYIFKDRSGHYDHLTFSVSVSPLGMAMQQRPQISNSYCGGCVYGVTANVSVASFLWGTQWLDTYNGVKYGYYAWNISATPGCSGAGSCQYPSLGAIGNYTATVNPWDNQYVNYWGCCSGVSYLRAYVNKWLGVSGWATQSN